MKARLTDQEKRAIYDANVKKAPSPNFKYVIILAVMSIILAMYYEVLPRIALMVVEKGWGSSANAVVTISYLIFFALLAPISFLALYIHKRLYDRYEERKKLVKKANSELWDELFNKEGHSDWRAVVEKNKDI